mgnify:CR=1 FL=1
MDEQTQCRRCGTCCRKGGPALHRADRSLVEGGAIPLKHLYTLRKGELAWENVRGGVVPLAAEIIKIKEADGKTACRFFDDAEKGCAIYGNRPLECRALKCWNTREIERIYRRDRLSRQDLLKTVPGLWDLVTSHETECSPERVRVLNDRDAGDRRALARITAYDREMRRLVTERSGLDPELLDFLLGRPLSRVIARERSRPRFRVHDPGVAASKKPAALSGR